MRGLARSAACLLALACIAAGAPVVRKRSPATEAEVTLARLPAGGVQPSAASGADGAIHVVYLAGDPADADVFYTTLPPGATTFSRPLRVNSIAGSAVALGSVRGPRIALGKNGWVHVLWNGSGRTGGSAGLQYARMAPNSGAFSQERNLMPPGWVVDGGGAIAADATGRVVAFWHASAPGVGEAHARVFMAASMDNGARFEPPRAVDPPELGACGCCGLAALCSRTGELWVLYRTARGGFERDMELLHAGPGAQHFTASVLDPWRISTCPMSTESLVEVGGGPVYGAWDTGWHVRWACLAPSRGGLRVQQPPQGGECQHPALAVSQTGQLLIAWTVGAGWNRGGAIGWQSDAPAGSVRGASGTTAGLPAWDVPAACARPAGGFLIIY